VRDLVWIRQNLWENRSFEIKDCYPDSCSGGRSVGEETGETQLCRGHVGGEGCEKPSSTS
jgi:hypothetical protein